MNDMNIEGLDYNTQRQPLTMPEYGREIQKMVDHAVSLPRKADRQRCANTIIKQMAVKAPQQQGGNSFRRTLWDHLYLMSNRQLDIDWPFDVAQAEKILAKPEPMGLPSKEDCVRTRHYGHLVEQLFEKLKTMDDGPARNELIRMTANQMKLNLYLWGHGSMSNEKVADDLAYFTDGAVQIDPHNFSFAPVMNKEPARQTANGKKKKKK